jgi:hypothetical protein
MVIALCEKPGCVQTKLGSAPWEVPIGTIRASGFETLRAISKSGYPYPKLEMTGQHPDAKGPNQFKIRTDEDYLKKEYPDMQYWKGCRVVRNGIAEYRSYKGQPPSTLGLNIQTSVIVKFVIDLGEEASKSFGAKIGDVLIEVCTLNCTSIRDLNVINRSFRYGLPKAQSVL